MHSIIFKWKETIHIKTVHPAERIIEISSWRMFEILTCVSSIIIGIFMYYMIISRRISIFIEYRNAVYNRKPVRNEWLYPQNVRNRRKNGERRRHIMFTVYQLRFTLYSINISLFRGKLQSQQTNICFETPKWKQINSLECYLISLFIYLNLKCQRNAIYRMISF